MQSVIDDDLTNVIYTWYCDAMRMVGKPVVKKGDYTKTYQYRAIKSFANKVQEWKLSTATTQALVYSVIKYAKKQGILRNGASILNMGHVLNICIKDLEAQQQSTLMIIENAKKVKKYLTDNNIYNKTSMIKSKNGSYPYIIVLYEAGLITNEFLAISKVMQSALCTLLQHERYKLPTPTELLKLRIKLYSDKDTRDKLSDILGSDFITITV